MICLSALGISALTTVLTDKIARKGLFSNGSKSEVIKVVVITLGKVYLEEMYTCLNLYLTESNVNPLPIVSSFSVTEVACGSGSKSLTRKGDSSIREVEGCRRIIRHTHHDVKGCCFLNVNVESDYRAVGVTHKAAA